MRRWLLVLTGVGLFGLLGGTAWAAVAFPLPPDIVLSAPILLTPGIQEAGTDGLVLQANAGSATATAHPETSPTGVPGPATPPQDSVSGQASPPSGADPRQPIGVSVPPQAVIPAAPAAPVAVPQTLSPTRVRTLDDDEHDDEEDDDEHSSESSTSRSHDD